MFENLAEKLIFVVFASFCACFARADEACPDGLCAVPQGEPNGSFPVLSPLPQSAVTPIEQAPRVRGYDRPGVRADHGDQTGRRLGKGQGGQGRRRRPGFNGGGRMRQDP